jgi:putative transposase
VNLSLIRHCLKLGQSMSGFDRLQLSQQTSKFSHYPSQKERNMFVAAERFISKLVTTYGPHLVSTDGGTWYPQVCRFLKQQQHLHSFYERSLVERTMQYIKERTESFDDYFLCRLENCKLKHVKNGLKLFINYHNKELVVVK